MSQTHFYEVKVKWDEQRMGTLMSPELSPIAVATPPEFPKGHPGIWSPEHLLVAAVNSCLMTTFLAIAEHSNLYFLAFECNAVGKLEMVDGKYMVSEITLTPQVTIADPFSREKAERVLQKSESNCLISNSVKSKIVMISEVIITNREPV